MRILFTLHNIACKGGSERVVINLANALSQIPNYEIGIVSYYTDTKAKNACAYWLHSDVQLSYLHTFDDVHANERGLLRILWRWTKTLIINLRMNKAYQDYDVIIESDFAFFYPRFKVKNTKYIKIMHSVINKWKAKNRFFDCIVFLNQKEFLRWQSHSKHVVKIPNFIPILPFEDLLDRALCYFDSMPHKDEHIQTMLQTYRKLCINASVYTDMEVFMHARTILKTFIGDSAQSNKKMHTLIAVGRMDAINNHKGFPRLIQAYSKIAHIFPNWRLEIIGEDQGQKQILESQIIALGMQDFIVLKSFTTNMESIYLQADIFVMSSHTESLPMVLIEASSFGLPLIAYDIETIRDCFLDNGILVKDNDEQAFCAELSMLMDNEEKRLSMGHNGIKLVKERFSKEYILQQWLELFHTLVNTK